MRRERGRTVLARTDTFNAVIVHLARCLADVKQVSDVTIVLPSQQVPTSF